MQWQRVNVNANSDTFSCLIRESRDVRQQRGVANPSNRTLLGKRCSMKAGTRRLLLVAAIAVLIAAATTVGYFVYAGGISNKVAEEKLRASRWFAQSLPVRIELESYWFDGPDVMRREHLDLAKLEKAGLVKIMGGDGGGAHAELTVEGQSAAASGWTRESDRLYFV